MDCTWCFDIRDGVRVPNYNRLHGSGFVGGTNYVVEKVVGLVAIVVMCSV
jgi:hypothetical protein